jgi:surfactin synthase thioesterase subunit
MVASSLWFHSLHRNPYARFRLFCFPYAGGGASILFLSGRSVPQWPDTDPPASQLPEQEFVERLRLLNGTPEMVL